MRKKQLPWLLYSRPDRGSESDCACSDLLTFASLGSPNPEVSSDCACVVETTSLSHVSSATSLWQASLSLYREPLPGKHELLFNLQGSATVAVLNGEAQQRFARFEEPQPLVTKTDEKFVALGLLTPYGSEAKILHSTPQTLTAWLHVTNACNLRCPYCYVHKRGREMDVTTGRAAIEAVIRSAKAHNFQAIKLKYAGGEPTLRWPLVRMLHAYAQTLTIHHGLDLHATVLSNGTLLTDAMIAWLRDQNVRLMISLDGIGAVQDAQRPSANGDGSFEQIAANIHRALEHGLSPYLSITVTDQNVAHLTDVVAFAMERDLLFNLNFVRDIQSASRLANPTVQQRWIQGLQDTLSVIEARLPRRRLIDGILDRSLLSSPHAYPCGAGRNYLVIDPQGNIARCQMCMDNVLSDVTADDPLEIIRQTKSGLQNIAVDDRPVCRDCPWRYWCGGGCPLLSELVYGSAQASPYCAIYRALFPKILYLEGLRLLKWGNST